MDATLLSRPPSASDTSSQSDEPCDICGDFFKSPEYEDAVEKPWDDVVTSSLNCTDCSILVRGCRGWLDGSGRQSWTPLQLLLDPDSLSCDSERDDLGHCDGLEDIKGPSSPGRAWRYISFTIFMMFDSEAEIPLSMFRVEG
jgi:hypothetical protein